MGIRLTAPGAPLDPTLPKLGDPGGLIGPGAMMYLDMGREALRAVPAPGQALTNWARGPAAGLTGAAHADLAPVMEVNDWDETIGRLELTSAGGLHGYVNPVSGNSAQIAAINILPAPLLAFIQANPAFEFYMDSVVRRTAEPVEIASSNGGSAPAYVAIRDGSQTGGSNTFYGLYMLSNTGNSAAQNTLLYPAGSWTAVSTGYNEDALELDAPALNSIARAYELPSAWASTTDPIRGRVQWTPPVSPGGTLQHGTSFILYSVYLECLTLSGRTHAEIRALRQAQLDTEFGPGGLYHTETWTNPTSVSW